MVKLPGVGKNYPKHLKIAAEANKKPINIFLKKPCETEIFCSEDFKITKSQEKLFFERSFWISLTTLHFLCLSWVKVRFLSQPENMTGQKNFSVGSCFLSALAVFTRW